MYYINHEEGGRFAFASTSAEVALKYGLAASRGSAFESPFLISTFYYSCKLIILYYINHEEGGRFAFASTSAEVALKYGLAASRGSAFESPFLISTFYYSCKLIILYYINHEEGGRFELPVGLSPQQFSRLPHSTALASLLNI